MGLSRVTEVHFSRKYTQCSFRLPHFHPAPPGNIPAPFPSTDRRCEKIRPDFTHTSSNLPTSNLMTTATIFKCLDESVLQPVTSRPDTPAIVGYSYQLVELSRTFQQQPSKEHTMLFLKTVVLSATLISVVVAINKYTTPGLIVDCFDKRSRRASKQSCLATLSLFPQASDDPMHMFLPTGTSISRPNGDCLATIETSGGSPSWSYKGRVGKLMEAVIDGCGGHHAAARCNNGQGWVTVMIQRR